MSEATWHRSKSTGNLFLRGRKKCLLGCVFQKDGGFAFWTHGQADDVGFPTEEAAIEALYQKMGWA